MVHPLGRLRFPASQSRGRRYPEPSHPYRSDFQRDRDRIIHTRAFRRLEDKTQVFGSGFSDHFRNRLTHTIEVAQISRTVAATLGLDEELTEALALAHDIGHPPFAHAGEHELNRQMQRFGDRFDHNLHALHLVETFEQRYARFPGLNLTFEVREGIVKHSRDFSAGELPEFEEYLPGQRPPLEAQLIDLCDEIAYNTADLDDAYAAHLFQLDEVGRAVPQFGEFLDSMQSHFPGAPERVQFQEALRALLNWLVSGLLEGTTMGVEAAGVQSIDEVRVFPSRLVGMTPSTGIASAELKQFLHRCVYFSDELIAARQESARKIAALFQHFLDHPDRLPPSYVEELDDVPQHRVICDYIAGMTDGYFHRIYQQELGPH